MRKRKGGVGRVHLPREIMMDILLRLPFDSILRCKQVSKEWKHMINDPMFYKLYRDNDSMALFLHKQHVYCLRIRHDKKKLTHAQNPRFTVHQIPIQLEYTRFSNALSYYHHQVLSRGSSNGLACVKGINGCFYFYNLFTGTGGSGSSYTVTDAPMHQLDDSWICYGFGYDARNDDYNILVVCDYHRHGIGSGFQFDINTVQNKDNTLFWVYSFKNQGWKPLDGFPYSTYYSWTGPPQATTIDGVLHWFVPNHPEEEVIITYDLHSGRFGEIPAPINAYAAAAAAALPHQTHYLGDLAELNGRLCYVHKMAFPNTNKPKPKHIYRLDVWVMNEYGVPHSWAKLVSMDCSKLHPLIPWKRNWQTPLVLHQCGDGRVLVLFVCHHVSGQLFWYDPLDHKFEVLVKSTWKRQRTTSLKSSTTRFF